MTTPATPSPECPAAHRDHAEHIFTVFATMTPLDGARVDCAGRGLVDSNGVFTDGTLSRDGRAVHIYGRRNGFVYLATVDDLGFVSKVPASWVTA